MALQSTDFDYVAGLARKNSALVLDPGKEYLVETRLLPLAIELGFTRLEDFIARLRNELGYTAIHAKVIDALTTNETLFFRDLHPFEAMRKEILPGLIQKKAATQEITIWSAACSTGQEPYSLAMLLREHFPQLAGWKVRILATDISPRVLALARQGEYSQFEVNRGLPANYLFKYFTKQGEKWQLQEQIRKMVDFRSLNLVQGWPGLPICDVVFLRNVLIYFDVPTKQGILGRVRELMSPDSVLFLGSAETTLNLDPGFETATMGNATAYRLRSA